MQINLLLHKLYLFWDQDSAILAQTFPVFILSKHDLIVLHFCHFRPCLSHFNDLLDWCIQNNLFLFSELWWNIHMACFLFFHKIKYIFAVVALYFPNMSLYFPSEIPQFCSLTYAVDGRKCLYSVNDKGRHLAIVRILVVLEWSTSFKQWFFI